MPIDTVFLLPGQGGYSPGLFAGETPSDVREVLEASDRVAAEFGRPGISELLTRADAPAAAELMQSDSFSLQLAIFAAAVGSFRLAERQGAPDVVVGHSMGEIAALTVAGAFQLQDGLRLVCHRSEALIAHCPETGSMVALGLPLTRTRHLVGLVAERGLAVAVSNAPQWTVVSGPEKAIATVVRLAETLNVRATRLPAPFPFHSPMLGIAAENFAEAVTAIPQRALCRLVYSPVAGGYLTDDTDAKALLARQLTTPVRFLDAVRELHADGAENFIECGKAGLLGLVRQSVPVAITHSPARSQVIETPALGHETVPASETAPAEAAAGGGNPTAEQTLEQLRGLYASALGYPLEMITGDADLEADLGIDSLKRAEMLVKVSEHFALGDSAQDGRFMVQSTLADLADLMSTVLPAAN